MKGFMDRYIWITDSSKKAVEPRYIVQQPQKGKKGHQDPKKKRYKKCGVLEYFHGMDVF